MTPFRRYIFLALVICAVIGAGIIPWPVNRLFFNSQLKQQFGAVTGLSLTHDHITLTLLPTPYIELNQVVISNSGSEEQHSDDNVLRSEKIGVQLKIWPLLFGQLEAYRVALVSPRIRWPGLERPIDFWTMVQSSLNAASSISLPTYLSITDGIVVNESRNPSILHRLNASLTWPSPGRPLDLNATALWRGEPVDLRVEKLLPTAFLAKQPSPLSLRISARPISFSFKGEIIADTMPELSGELSLLTGSLGQAIAWLRTPLSYTENAGRLAIKGSARLSDEGFSMPDARIEVEGGTLEGSIGARISDARRIIVSATLDATDLDFNSLLFPIKSPAAGSGWQSAPMVDHSSVMANDLDIRLSANRATIGSLDLQDVAAGILVTNGKVELALNQANLDEGKIKSRVLLIPSKDNIATRISGTFEGIDTSKAILRLFGPSLLTGRANGQVILEGIGQSPDAIAHSLSGTAFVHITNGELAGVDLVSVLKRVRQHPLATALDWRGGHSPFTTMDATLAIHEGEGNLSGRANFTGGLVGLMSGKLGIAERSLSLQLRVNDDHSIEGDGEAQELIGFPIEISGSWDYPIVTPDIRMLIERSSASLPLQTPNAGQ